MKLIVSCALILVMAGCGIGAVKEDNIENYMLPGIHDTYRIKEIFNGEKYKYYVAVSLEPIHADKIYFVKKQKSVTVLTSENLWKVVEDDKFVSGSLSEEFLTYLFEVEYPEFILFGEKEVWKNSPYYCDDLEEQEKRSEEGYIYASYFNIFLKVKYDIKEGGVRKFASRYECEV